jgi:hypothetical protein
LARYLNRRSNPSFSPGRLERAGILIIGGGLSSGVGNVLKGVAGPVAAMLGPFGGPVATLVGSVVVEMGAKALGVGSYADDLGNGGYVAAGLQTFQALGLPIGLTSFPGLPSGAAPAGAMQLTAGNTPTGTGQAQAAPAGGRYAPSPGYGSLSPQLGVGL